MPDSHKGKAEFSFPKDYTTFLLVIEDIYINESVDVKADHLLLFAYEGETFSITASKNSVILIVSGEPLKESIAAYGPFVMNTQKNWFKPSKISTRVNMVY